MDANRASLVERHRACSRAGLSEDPRGSGHRRRRRTGFKDLASHGIHIALLALTTAESSSDASTPQRSGIIRAPRPQVLQISPGSAIALTELQGAPLRLGRQEEAMEVRRTRVGVRGDH
jgi:hypothetical protein